jgi:hypothetical protein
VPNKPEHGRKAIFGGVAAYLKHPGWARQSTPQQLGAAMRIANGSPEVT